ncbi:MAG: helix-turn-helix domain-containing protein [Flavobacterium sp. JAD_PAG50586_2]|nr:MAG: helix-turn-helix domain-containing protein [Flavobacterium sp. JAD_PAG50586_2]
MNEEREEFIIPTVGNIKKLLEPIYSRLDKIDTALGKKQTPPGQTKYYRNQDLKKIFGLSSNTIIKYRETGILPYTKVGDIFFYDVKTIEAILIQNKVEI